MNSLFIVLMTTARLSQPGAFELWDSLIPVPSASEVVSLQGVRFSVIKRRETSVDGFSWLHGVTLTPHQGKLIATWGANREAENTATEVVQSSCSEDDGYTWSSPITILEGPPGLAASHGVTWVHEDVVRGLFPRFEKIREHVRVEALTRDCREGKWETHGIVIQEGFWPMGAPIRLGNGNTLVSGIQVKGDIESSQNPPAVAISQGRDLSHWRVVVIPKSEDLSVWGESAVIADGSELLLISRGWSASPWAYVSHSQDFGETWSPLRQSNLPMSPSKPFAGTLQSGVRYLIANTYAGCEGRRWPLTIALMEPDKRVFSRIYSIRSDICPGPGESTKGLALAYPYAVEHKGSLYVVYSNDGGRGANLNSAELAVIPLPLRAQ